MRRRRILMGTGFALVATTAAGQSSRPLLAMLSPASALNQAVMRNVNQPFKEALEKLGYVPGRNIDIVERFADGDESRLPMLAAELVALQPQVLFTHTSNAAAAAARATRSIPIVVGPAGEMMLRELAGGSLARPSTNVTGFVLGSAEIDDKCVMLLMEAVPAARRVGVLINPGNPGQQRYTAALKGSLAVPGKVLIRLESSGPADIDAAMAKAKAEHIAALFIADDALIAGDAVVRQRVLRFAAASGVAVASSHQNFARGGALLAMGPSLPDLAARAAGYVDRILKGAQPSDLPVQLPTVWSVIVNLKVAKALGLTIPPAILARADEVIQ